MNLLDDYEHHTYYRDTLRYWHLRSAGLSNTGSYASNFGNRNSGDSGEKIVFKYSRKNVEDFISFKIGEL